MAPTLVISDIKFRQAIQLGLHHQPYRRLVVAVALGGGIYGAVMGCYGGFVDRDMLRVAYSAVKVPMLLSVTFMLSLPSFFVFNSLLGLRDDFKEVVQGIIASQAMLAMVLASLAPYTLVWNFSTSNYALVQLFSGLMFAASCLSSQLVLWHVYRPLVARDQRHWYMMWCWLGIYSFVGIQMGWVLRPFIGMPGSPVEFFRHNSWSNAYGFVWDLLMRVVGG